VGSAERRQRENEETRRRIIDAARDLFVRNGYEATSMRAIAKAIEYTPTAIYHHFESKDHLLAEICGQDFRALAAVFMKLADVADPLDRIMALGEAYVDFALRNPMHYRLMFMADRAVPSKDVTRGDPSEDAYAFLRTSVQAAISAGRFRPEYDDADQVAQILWGTCHGVVSLFLVKGDDGWIDFGDVRETSLLMRRAVMMKSPSRTLVKITNPSSKNG